MYFASKFAIKTFDSVCLCECMSVCMCACLFLPAEQNNKCNTRDQVSHVVLSKYFRMKNLRRHAIDNHSRDVQISNCAKECQLSQAEPRGMTVL